VTTTGSPEPQDLPLLLGEISPDDLARIRAASARDRRRKFLYAALITVIGIGASIMSCVGQSFGYRQARALEGIEQELREIRDRPAPQCPATVPPLHAEAP
jgi:hypothetical protein